MFGLKMAIIKEVSNRNTIMADSVKVVHMRSQDTMFSIKIVKNI
jgi:hypothetical protein